MEAIDCHAHIYPTKIASKAAHAVGDFYGVPMAEETATADGLIADAAGTPIGQFFVFSVATHANQVQNINSFIASECRTHPNFTGLMTMHQDFENPEGEIDRAVGLGLRGLKLHPDTQRVNADDPRLYRIYEIIQGRIPLVLHAGDYRYDYSHPRRIRKILHDFPRLTVNAAHFGGWSIFDLAFEILGEERCFVDTSSAQALLGPRRVTELCRLFGVDRVMFGSDFPMWLPSDEYKMFSALSFTDDEFDKMLTKNALRFIGDLA